jgi:hypothetical protein
MAYFKLSLLTFSVGADKVNYSTQTISEFISQQEALVDSSNFKVKSSFCYTNNEQFSIHANNDKEVTFLMTEKVLSDLGE